MSELAGTPGAGPPGCRAICVILARSLFLNSELLFWPHRGVHVKADARKPSLGKCKSKFRGENAIPYISSTLDSSRFPNCNTRGASPVGSGLSEFLALVENMDIAIIPKLWYPNVMALWHM